MNNPILLNERAARLELGGIGRTRLYQLINTGELPSVKLGGRRLFKADDLRRFVAKLSDGQGGDDA